MKNLRTAINGELEKLDTKWRNLPVKIQIRYVLYLFAFYLIMGIGVLVKVCYDLGKENAGIAIDHIETPPVVQEGPTHKQSGLNINKDQRNGRERE